MVMSYEETISKIARSHTSEFVDEADSRQETTDFGKGMCAAIAIMFNKQERHVEVSMLRQVLKNTKEEWVNDNS